jgi:hypothetical protein
MVVLAYDDVFRTLVLWLWLISMVGGIFSAFSPLWAIFAAILAKYLYDYWASWKYRSNYKCYLRSEITRAIDLLGRDENKPGTGNLLPTDTWSSIVNSGLLKLFWCEEVKKLSNVYFNIQAYNYEAGRTRDVAERYRFSITSRERRHMHRYWINASIRLDKPIRLDLLKELKSLEDASWLK